MERRQTAIDFLPRPIPTGILVFNRRANAIRKAVATRVSIVESGLNVLPSRYSSRKKGQNSNAGNKNNINPAGPENGVMRPGNFENGQMGQNMKPYSQQSEQIVQKGRENGMLGRSTKYKKKHFWSKQQLGFQMYLDSPEIES